MTLYELLPKNGDEVTVWDKDYDMETYFSYTKDGDDWDKAMMDLAKLLQVVEERSEGITVDFTGLIEPKVDNLKDLFVDNDIDAIMSELDLILAGNVSEKWLIRFVEALGKGV